MSHVHSAGRRRPIHSAGGVPVHSTGRQYAHADACTTLIMTRTLPRVQPQHINTVWTTDIMALRDRPDITCISYFLPSILPLGPHVGAQYPCMCLPWAIKGMAHNVTRHTLTHTHSDWLRPNSDSDSHTIHRQWSRVLRSGGLNHSKSLCVLMFILNPYIRQNV
jgi:hypothetical protein